MDPPIYDYYIYSNFEMLFCKQTMASLPQMSSYALGAQLHKKRHFSNNLVASYNQFAKPSSLLSPISLVTHKKKPMRELREEKCHKENWKTWCSNMDDGSTGGGVAPTSPSVQVVQEFYKAFNSKDTQRLEHLLSPHCTYHDLLFYGPYDGKENVINFLGIAMDALGPNVHIRLEDVHESNHFFVTVFWHLEWKTKKIPFTSGCRIFNIEEVEGRLLISRITGLEELPVKPGELVLKVYKTIRTLFDRYPLAAEAILDSHAHDDDKQGPGIDTHFDLFGRKH